VNFQKTNKSQGKIRYYIMSLETFEKYWSIFGSFGLSVKFSLINMMRSGTNLCHILFPGVLCGPASSNQNKSQTIYQEKSGDISSFFSFIMERIQTLAICYVAGNQYVLGEGVHK
jgi:hypothetical protein